MALGPMRLACNGVSCDCSVGHRPFNHGSRPFLIHIPVLEILFTVYRVTICFCIFHSLIFDA